MNEVLVPTADGETVKKFSVHKFSPLDGRFIIAGYPLALLSKDQTYASNVEAMKKLLCYCSVEVNGEQVHFTSDELINEHVPDWWTLVNLEYECLQFNCSMLKGGDFLSTAKQSMIAMLKQLVAEHIERVA